MELDRQIKGRDSNTESLAKFEETFDNKSLTRILRAKVSIVGRLTFIALASRSLRSFWLI
jgi:hypothetical protein